MNKYIPYISYSIFMLIIGGFLFTPKQKVIYKTKIKECIINYKAITDSITNVVLSQPADTQYIYIDSTIISYKDSLVIKDSINLVPYSVVSFNYNDSLLSADVSTYFNINGSKYDFKYTLNPSEYGFNINYTSPDTLLVNFKHKHFFSIDSIIISKSIDTYINNRINEEKRPWWDKGWIGYVGGILTVGGIAYLIK